MLGTLLVLGAVGACIHSPHDEGAPHWEYDSGGGPPRWGELSPAYQRCTSGRRQSPVNLELAQSERATLPPLAVHYATTPATEVNNGHTIQDSVPPGEWVELGSSRFDLEQFHFHHPSEHTLDGAHFPLEVHFVHHGASGALLVVGVLVAEGAANPGLQVLFEQLPERHHAAQVSIDPALLLPADRRFVTYEGSLTTPPCTEGVTWIVLTRPITASAAQIRQFRARYPHNNRPVMPLNGRHVRRTLDR